MDHRKLTKEEINQIQKTIIPIDYLNKDESSLLQQTKSMIQINTDRESQRYYESVLDLLAKIAFRRFRSMESQNPKKESVSDYLS